MVGLEFNAVWEVLSSGMSHFVSIASDYVVQLDSEGPFQINYVNPADDPRNMKK